MTLYTIVILLIKGNIVTLTKIVCDYDSFIISTYSLDFAAKFYGT